MAFQSAVRTGQPGPLAHLLARDVRLTADGGGKVVTVKEILKGADVLAFVTGRLSQWWSSFEFAAADINGSPGLVLRDGENTLGALTFSYNAQGEVADIFVVRNPDKLSNLSMVSVH